MNFYEFVSENSCFILTLVGIAAWTVTSIATGRRGPTDEGEH